MSSKNHYFRAVDISKINDCELIRKFLFETKKEQYLAQSRTKEEIQADSDSYISSIEKMKCTKNRFFMHFILYRHLDQISLITDDN